MTPDCLATYARGTIGGKIVFIFKPITFLLTTIFLLFREGTMLKDFFEIFFIRDVHPRMPTYPSESRKVECLHTKRQFK